MDISQRIKQNKTVLFLGIAISILIIAGVYTFIRYKKSQQQTNTTQQTTKNYPKLDKNLNAIINAADPMHEAIVRKLAVTEDGMKVLITVNNDSFMLSYQYGKQTARYGKFIQADVPFDTLETLAKNEKIDSIAATERAVTIPKGTKVFHNP